MRTLILVIALLPTIASAAEQKKPTAVQQQKKPAPTMANPCAQYGAGFVQVQGTSTCVKLSGSVRIDVGGSR